MFSVKYERAFKNVSMILSTQWSKDDRKAVTLLEGYGFKFKVTYDNTNGFPQQMDLQVLQKDSTWKFVANNEDIGFEPISYVSHPSEMMSDNGWFLDEWVQYIDLLHGGDHLD